ncbi:DUF6241 domain-containing protein [Virgibacillus necropolis]|uniref:CTP synthase n=1 Tax=Virgibacillus necropolis TaxID=163877 RepID=A0A221MGG6_9BACI|nr:DUF6241 domain-containing protein [Virgibacillus necropolis]ASN06753.1 hypothetical protein CFK40_17880 [Virgibacillus necropolis]
MKKAIIIFSCALVVLGLVAWGTYSWLSNYSETADNTSVAKEKEVTEEVLQENRKEIEGTITEEDLATFKERDLNPFGEEQKLNELNDYIYQEYIHGMSHQKVEASKKWGFYEIHSNRIKWLLEGLDEVELEHETAYRNILEKWKEENFSSVDGDHNAIWELQGGTVGRATGILSAEEEQAYINNNTD